MESKKSRFALKRMAKRFGLIGAGRELLKLLDILNRPSDLCFFFQKEKENLPSFLSDGVLMYTRVFPPLRVPRSREEVCGT